MKTKMQAFLIGILLTLGISSGAYAQRFRGGEMGGGHFYYGGGVRTVVVGGGYGWGWGWGLGYPGLYMGWGYPLYGYPYGYSPYGYGGTSRLQMQIADIKQDYADKIESVRSDNTLTGKERRQQVRELKKEMDNAINEAHRNYWKGGSNTNPAPSNGNPTPAPGNNNQNNNSQNNG